MPSTHLSPTAAERKRRRDRVAQQNLRNKRSQHIQALEQQVKYCQENHKSQGDETLLRTIHELREENHQLRRQQQRLQVLFSSCQEILGSSTATVVREDECPQPDRSTQASNSRIDEATCVSNQFPAPESPDSVQYTNAAPQPSAHMPSTSLHSRDSIAAHTSPIMELPIADGNIDGGSESQESASAMNYRFQFDQIMDGHDFTSALLDFTTSHMNPPIGVLPAVEDDHDSNEAMVDTFNAQRRQSQSCDGSSALDFPYAFEQSMPFLDSGLLTALDLWAERSIDGLPRWARIPLRTSSIEDAKRSPWDADLSAILQAPDSPSPLDLLFGSKQNPLATSVQQNVRKWYKGGAERLAIGWLVYHYVKWRTQPTLERFSRLPNWIKPMLEQTSSRHPGCLDLILWQKMRLNMLKCYDRYDMNKFLRLYCTSLRLKWSKDDDVLIPNDANTYSVRPDFFARFMSEDGWGLENEFISQYPELLEGLDVQKVLISVV